MLKNLFMAYFLVYTPHLPPFLGFPALLNQGTAADLERSFSPHVGQTAFLHWWVFEVFPDPSPTLPQDLIIVILGSEW